MGEPTSRSLFDEEPRRTEGNQPRSLETRLFSSADQRFQTLAPPSPASDLQYPSTRDEQDRLALGHQLLKAYAEAHRAVHPVEFLAATELVLEGLAPQARQWLDGVSLDALAGLHELVRRRPQAPPLARPGRPSLARRGARTMTVLSIAPEVLNRVAPLARSRPWRRLFSLNGDDQALEARRIKAAIEARGCSAAVAERYLFIAPLEDELQVLLDYVSDYPDYYLAKHEVSTKLDDSLVDFRAQGLDNRERAQLADLLELDPELLCPPVPPSRQLLAWHEEVASMWELTAGDLAEALSAPWPDEVNMEWEPEVGSPEMDSPLASPAVNRWFRWAISDGYRMLALEQRWRGEDFVPDAERNLALQTAPASVLDEIGAFWRTGDHGERAAAAWLVRGVVRAERQRRCGTADWSPLYPMVPWWRSERPAELLAWWRERRARHAEERSAGPQGQVEWPLEPHPARGGG